MNRRIVILFAFLTLSFGSCSKVEEAYSLSDDLESSESANSLKRRIILDSLEIFQDTLTIEPINHVLGIRRNNPYSIRNMQRASDTLSRRCNMSPRTLVPTNLYIRFLPQDSAEFKSLESSGFELFDVPLEYELVGEGNGYHDPSLPENQITWQYSCIPIDASIPSVEYEILDTCYIPRWEIIPDLIPMSIRPLGFHLDEDEYEMELDYLANEMANPGLMDGPLINGEAINSFSSKPSGHVYVKINGENRPVKRVKVRTWHFVKIDQTYTNENGYYHMSKSYTCKPRYSVKYENERGFKIYGWLAELVPMFYWSQRHSKSGYNIVFDDPDDKMWLGAVVNNEVYDYYKMSEANGMVLPPQDLHISVINGANYGGGAPMLHHMGGMMMQPYSASSLGEAFVQAILCSTTFYISAILSCVAPDIVIKNGTYESISTTVFHEMNHASHFSKAGREYWAHYIQYILDVFFDESFSSSSLYGDGTDNESTHRKYCELGEAWAYANQRLYLKEQGLPVYGGIGEWFEPSILALFELVDQGVLTKPQILSCMDGSITSIDALYNRLCLTYPSKRNAISTVFGNNRALHSLTRWRVLNATGGTLEIDMRKNGSFWKSLTTDRDTLSFLFSSSMSDSIDLKLTNPSVYPDTVLMVVNGQFVYRQLNDVVYSRLFRPLFQPNDWLETFFHNDIGDKNVRTLDYTLSNTDYE